MSHSRFGRAARTRLPRPPLGSSLGLIPLLDAQGSHSYLRSMDWMRAGPAPLLDERRAPGGVPKFVLVDSNNRVRELTDTRKAATAPSDGGGFLMRRQAAPPTRAPLESENVDMEPSPEELAEQAQLEQQLRVQKEEMRFLAPLPKPQAPSLQFAAHANTYAAPASTPSFPRHSHSHHANQAPSPPPVSPFASLAVSAPSKTSPMGGFGHARPTNPFNGATVKIENSPRLPSLSAFRSGSPGSAHLNGSGIPSHRPPPLSLRSFSDVSSLSASASSQPSPLHRPPPRSHSSGSFYAPSPRASTPPMYSQSLPGVSFLQDRAASSRLSFDSADTVGLSSEDDDSAHGGMLLLSSSIEHSMNGAFTVGSAPGSLGAAAAAAARSGRVCRYSNCNNIARSRGLCRTHGGGKRCSHPNCNKSAQANRKCIAHGGGTPCSFGDCEKTAQSRGLCKAHGGGARCKYPDCPKSSQSKGLCRGHGGGIKCKEDGCEKWVQKNGYCIKHGRERSMTS